jgi:hypothetical protein
VNSEEVRRETFGFLHFNQKMDKSEGFAPPLFTFHSSLFTSNLGLSQSDKPKFEIPTVSVSHNLQQKNRPENRGGIFISNIVQQGIWFLSPRYAATG